MCFIDTDNALFWLKWFTIIDCGLNELLLRIVY